jgi:hypothetical protein
MSESPIVVREIRPSGSRLVVYANPLDGKVYELDILSFVVLMTRNSLPPEAASDEVSRMSGPTALALSRAGWFTMDEYAQAWAAAELETIDDELRDMMTGEG